MKLNTLNEYRCRCGKLLFKGFIILSSIEIKCKRCGYVSFFQKNDQKASTSFSLTTNSFGNITDACCGISLMGASREYFLGKKINEIFPLIDQKKIKKDNFLKIRHSILFLRENKRKTLESYIFPYFKNKQFNGYHIFNKILKD